MSFFPRPFKPIFIKWFKSSIILFSGTAILFCLLLVLTFGTQAGTQWLFGMVSSYSNGRFIYHQVAGNLLDRIEIRGVEYQDNDYKIKIDQLLLSWDVKQLFQSRFYLEQVKINGVRLEELQSLDNGAIPTAVPADEEIMLSDIELPLDIIINDAILSDVHLLKAKDDKVYQFELLTLKADAHALSSTVNLSRLTIKAAEFAWTGDGQIVLKDQFPLQLNSQLQLNRAELPQTLLQGSMTGNLTSLNILHSITGEVAGEVDITIHNPLSELTWAGMVNIKNIPIHLLDHSLEQRDTNFDLTLKGEGNNNQIELKPLKINLADGTLVLTGTIAWLPELHWDLLLDTRQIDPALIYPQWPGDINLRLESQGRYSNIKNKNKNRLLASNFSLKFAIKHLQGSLHGQPLSGKGSFAWQDGLLEVQGLQLNSGKASLMVDGVANKQLDLKWQMNIPELTHLIPDMAGELIGKGQLTGSQTHPIIAGKIRAGKLLYDTINLNQTVLDFSVSNDETYSSHITLMIDQINQQQNQLNDIFITIKGTPNSHKIELESSFLDNSLQLQAVAGYKVDDRAWLADINKVTIEGKTIGSWQQKEDSRLFVSSEQVNLDKLCLFDQNSRFCASAQWQKNNTVANLQLNNVQLARIKPWLADAIDELNGQFNLDARITMQERLKAIVNIDVTPGSVSYFLEPHKRIRLKHQNGKFRAVLSEQALNSHWNLNVGEHSIEGHLEIPRTALETDLESAPIKGNIKFHMKELGLFTAMIPEVRDMQGYLRADLQLSGVISKPIITGVAEFVSEKISIPVTGVTLEKVNIHLKGTRDQRVKISGQIHSGAGKLAVNGDINLDANQNWPVQLHLNGENFQIANLPELEAIISPKVKLIRDIDGIKIKGQIEVPQAGIFVNELPEGSKNVSDDAIVVGEEAPKPADIGVDMTVKLGDKVRLKAFGLDTWLTGQMRINKSPEQLSTANGELRTTHGTFRAYGQNLTIEQGRVSYAGGYLDNPGLNIRASKVVKDITVGVMATGTAKDLEVTTFSSDAGLNSKDIVALLLTGQKFDDARSARIYAGTELTDELSVGVNTGVGDEGSEFIVRYKLRKNLYLEGSSSAKKSGGNLIYTIEIE